MIKRLLIPIILTLLLYVFGIINQAYYSFPLTIILFLVYKGKSFWLTYTYNSFLSIVLILDILLRVTNLVPLYYRPFELLNQPHPVYEELHHLRQNEEITMDEIGDLGAMLGNPEYQIRKTNSFITDELGFRNDVGQSQKQNSAILIGDSYAMGSGVDQGGIVSKLVSKEIYNLGFPGGIGHSSLLLKSHYDKISLKEGHNIYLIFFEGNDYFEAFSSLSSINTLNSIESFFVKYKSFRKRSPIRQIYTRLLYFDYDENKRKLITVEDNELIYKVYKENINKADWDSFQANINFNSLNNLISKNGGQLKVIIIPSKEIFNSSEDPKKEELKNILLRNDIPFIDAFSLMKESNLDSQELWLRDDTHLSSKGNAIIAKAIEEDLLSSN